MNKKNCVLSKNFISLYKINRTFHGPLGIRILSSSAESISHGWAKRTSERYFQHSKIKFVSPRGHVISSISWKEDRAFVCFDGSLVSDERVLHLWLSFYNLPDNQPTKMLCNCDNWIRQAILSIWDAQVKKHWPKNWSLRNNKMYACLIWHLVIYLNKVGTIT